MVLIFPLTTLMRPADFLGFNNVITIPPSLNQSTALVAFISG